MDHSILIERITDNKKKTGRLLIFLLFVSIIFLMPKLFSLAQHFQQSVLGIDWIIVYPPIRVAVILSVMILFAIIIWGFKSWAGSQWKWDKIDTFICIAYFVSFSFYQVAYFLVITD